MPKSDEQRAGEYRERAQRLRENARGLIDQKVREDLLKTADECDAIADGLSGKKAN